MSILTLPHDEELLEEFDDMGSFNHSTVQANITYLLKLTGNFTVSVELSLDSSSLDKSDFNVKDELIPDVCIYPKRQLVRSHDILKMEEMPLLVVEVLSYRQFQSSLIEKFKAYFALGVVSCWLVDPLTQTIHVYSSSDQWRTFTLSDHLNDKKLDIDFAVAEVFEL